MHTPLITAVGIGALIIYLIFVALDAYKYGRYNHPTNFSNQVIAAIVYILLSLMAIFSGLGQDNYFAAFCIWAVTTAVAYFISNLAGQSAHED